jgi:hypothetical protein
VWAALRTIEAAVAAQDRRGRDQGLDALSELWTELQRELEQAGRSAPAITRLAERKG